jgi:hypothetical protein
VVVGQWLHLLIDHLDMNDGRSMLEAHFFGEQTVDRLVRADLAGRCGVF